MAESESGVCVERPTAQLTSGALFLQVGEVPADDSEVHRHFLVLGGTAVPGERWSEAPRVEWTNRSPAWCPAPCLASFLSTAGGPCCHSESSVPLRVHAEALLVRAPPPPDLQPTPFEHSCGWELV